MSFFFFNDTTTTQIYTLSLHDALPISLEQSLNYLVRRHEALRLIFPAENGAPVAEISPEFTVSLPLVDRKSTRLNSSHPSISYAVFCLKKKKKTTHSHTLLVWT